MLNIVGRDDGLEMLHDSHRGQRLAQIARVPPVATAIGSFPA